MLTDGEKSRERLEFSEIDDDDDDEFEPLFDYNRVYQPPPDDDSDEDVPALTSQACQTLHAELHPKPKEVEFDKQIEDPLEDDDWLPPPPKCAKISLETDPTICRLRQQRAELLSLTTDAALKNLEAKARGNSDLDSVGKVAYKREKLVVSIQNKDGNSKPFRIYMDDKFEKLFKAYAQSVGSIVEKCVFSFDGRQIRENCTPEELGLENEDIIEVNETT
eukprot:c20212_g1_i1 orf=315-974(-)